MVQRETNMSLNILKKDCYSGGMNGMRYLFEKKEDNIVVTIWPEPFCYAKTSEELKKREEFPFNEEGREQAIEWLNTQYVDQKSRWKNALQHQ